MGTLQAEHSSQVRSTGDLILPTREIESDIKVVAKVIGVRDVSCLVLFADTWKLILAPTCWIYIYFA